MFATVHSGSPRYLWQTDGTAEGTKVIKTFDQGFTFTNLFLVSGKAFFCVDDEAYGMEILTSDGTEEGTKVIDLHSRFCGHANQQNI
ncbi:MAG: hypothetical protein WDO15_25680 [Bacteroidota bacterium]